MTFTKHIAGAAPIVVAAASLLLTSAAYSRSADDWPALHRPLHLPQADASRCPEATKPARLGRGIWNGGPAGYLESVGPAAEVGVIDITDSPPTVTAGEDKRHPGFSHAATGASARPGRTNRCARSHRARKGTHGPPSGVALRDRIQQRLSRPVERF
jgi:hypothetical protein